MWFGGGGRNGEVEGQLWAAASRGKFRRRRGTKGLTVQ